MGLLGQSSRSRTLCGYVDYTYTIHELDESLQHTALQSTATHYNTLQRTATVDYRYTINELDEFRNQQYGEK